MRACARWPARIAIGLALLVPTPSPAARGDAAIYLQIGREALERGDLGEARRALESARTAAPGDAAILALLGRLLVRQGEHAAAVAVLAPLMSERRHDAAARAYGVALQALERDAEAERVLARVVAHAAGDMMARYYLGLARFRRARLSESVQALTPVADAAGPYRAPAALLLGSARLRLGQPDAARAALAIAEQSDQPAVAARARRMSRRIGASRHWSIALIMGVEQDDNVLQAPENDSSPVARVPQADQAVVLLATVGWRPPALRGLGARYTGFLRELVENDAQDFVGQFVTVDVGGPQMNGVMAGYTAQHFLLDRAHYLLAHQLHAGWGTRRGSIWLGADYRVRWKDFSDRFEAFDGYEHGPRLTLSWRPQPLEISARYRWIDEHTAGTGLTGGGSEFDYTGHLGAVDARVLLGAGVRAGLGAGGQLRDYDNDSPLLRTDGSRGPRADERLEIRGDVAWQADPHWQLLAGVRYQRNASNVSAFAFTKTVSRITVTFTW